MSESPPPIDSRNIYLQEIEEKGLNNFYSDVVGGYRRIGLKKIPKMLTKKDPDIRMGKSAEEYWKDIDEVFKQMGIDKNKVGGLQEQMRNGKGKREDLLRELNVLLVPVYVRLRERGYSQTDLWS